MLESLTLRNFQKWSVLHIEFDHYLTVLSGCSNIGKSATMRALEWLCLNQFRGDWYIRRGCKSTSVSLTVDNQTITRYRGPEGNGYKFNNQTYEALYGSVPEPVTNVLQIGEYSFTSQFDGPLWLLLSKAEVSRQLNSIVNLDLIDRTLGDLASQVRKAKDNVETSQQRLQDARQRKKELTWVLDADHALTEIEEIEEKQQETKHEISDLTNLLINIQEQQTLLEGGESELTLLTDIVAIGNKVVTMRKQAQELENLLEQVYQAQDRVGVATVSFEAAELQLKEYSEGRCPLCGQHMQEE